MILRVTSRSRNSRTSNDHTNSRHVWQHVIPTDWSGRTFLRCVLKKLRVHAASRPRHGANSAGVRRARDSIRKTMVPAQATRLFVLVHTPTSMASYQLVRGYGRLGLVLQSRGSAFWDEGAGEPSGRVQGGGADAQKVIVGLAILCCYEIVANTVFPMWPKDRCVKRTDCCWRHGYRNSRWNRRKVQSLVVGT